MEKVEQDKREVVDEANELKKKVKHPQEKLEEEQAEELAPHPIPAEESSHQSLPQKPSGPGQAVRLDYRPHQPHGGMTRPQYGDMPRPQMVMGCAHNMTRCSIILTVVVRIHRTEIWRKKTVLPAPLNQATPTWSPTLTLSPEHPSKTQEVLHTLEVSWGTLRTEIWRI